MHDILARAETIEAMRAEGRYGDLLAYLEHWYAEAEDSPAPERTDYFMVMFQWSLLIEDHPPARQALAQLRDEQVRRLLDGKLYTGTAEPSGDGRAMFRRVRRYSMIVEMNEMLADPASTHALFLQLDAGQPELARRYAWQALPAIVEVGDFRLADRYRGDPLAQLETVKEAARNFPLFPPPGQAPRLAAELTNLTREAGIAIAVLRGLGREAEAEAVRTALLGALENEEVRALAERELEEPGAITRLVVAHQMAQEA